MRSALPIDGGHPEVQSVWIYCLAKCTCCGLTGKLLPFEKWMDIGQCQQVVLNHVGLKGQCFFEMVCEQMGQSFFELVKAHVLV